jgi:hypothetical protein
MLCPLCKTQNPDGAGRCSACNASLLPFSVEIETGPDPYLETNVGKAEGLINLIYNLIASWVNSFMMRREIRKELGRKPTNQDLSSIDTWMKVRDEETKVRHDKPFPR